MTRRELTILWPKIKNKLIYFTQKDSDCEYKLLCCGKTDSFISNENDKLIPISIIHKIIKII